MLKSVRPEYLVGFGYYHPVRGKGNNAGVGEYVFPLTLKEAEEKVSNTCLLPNSAEYKIFRLVAIKSKKARGK
jgi:hypothetical protein